LVPPGERLITTVAGRSIGVFNVDGRFYALRNRCPHQGAELCRGLVRRAVESSEPGVIVEREQPVLRCPWHGWEFRIDTGESWFDPDQVRVRRYEVGIAHGADVVGPRLATERVLVAETLEVSVVADYIVVDFD
jgi:nitrite reductase/ring-hydroxylating ferredoxin subunit